MPPRAWTAAASPWTPRYQLRPGLRAVGLRLQIDSGPSYAEGGSSDRLVLLVAESKQNFRVVLADLAMSSWQLTGDIAACSQDAGCARDADTRTLSLAATATAGWRDLLLTTRTVNDANPALIRQTSKLLRMGKSGRYD